MKAKSRQENTKLDPKRINRAALQLFFNISDHWELSTKEQRVLLGEPPESTFFKWKAELEARRLNRDTLDRISYLSGIYKALHILLPSARAADEWIKKPNKSPVFAGNSALNRMLAGGVEDLAFVRRYLDAQRG